MIEAAADFTAVEENLRFLILQVIKQVEDAMSVFGAPSATLEENIRQRDDYIDNMKSVIENKCFARILELNEPAEKRSVDLLRSALVITTNLERIADYCENMVDQMRYLPDPSFVRRFDYVPFFRELLCALELVFEAQKNYDSAMAMRICRAENNLDALYKTVFQTIMSELAAGKEAGPLITALFIFRYLERAGDRLLNIGEAIIFSIMGEKFKIHEYRVLEETLGEADMPSISDVDIEAIWGTRSGCRISRVSGKESANSGSPGVIFKHGKIKKLLREMENIKRWSALEPGLPPMICGSQTGPEEGAILLEYLRGHTIQDITLNGDGALLEKALATVCATLVKVWSATKRDTAVNARYVAQVRLRLADVYRLHPGFRSDTKQIGGVVIAPLDILLDRAAPIAETLSAPFSVFIHGDFNINNIIYDPVNGRTHFIDLYRSCDQDYIQDVSVFLVSLFRLPVFTSDMRSRLNDVAMRFSGFAMDFASENRDTTVHARLALGLARSFITSTRFEYRADFARKMALRGVYLLEKLIAHDGKPWEDFRLPVDVFAY